MSSYHQEDKLKKVRERVKEMRKFYVSLTSYAIFISLLAALNYYIDQWNHPWFLWAALGWGIGLLFQASSAFQWNLGFGKDWEERKVKEILDKEKNNLK